LGEEKISLETIRASIKERGAEWQAARTSVSELSVEKQKSILTLIPTRQELQMVSKLDLDKPLGAPRRVPRESRIPKSGSVGLPTSIDWRNVNGVNWATPIKDEGIYAACVAFGTLGALESLLKIRVYQDPNVTIDLSEAHLHLCSGGGHMNVCCDYLKNNGVPDEACFPYPPETAMTCADTCSDWRNRIDHTKIPSWTNTKDVNTMKTNLVNNGPQITGVVIYDDFLRYESGIYEHVAGRLLGYECVGVFGYNDSDGYWICKNHWGTRWGESGWFRIAYGECGIQDVFGMWNMQTPPALKGSDYAQYLLVDYSFTSTTRTLWAYAGNAWRYKVIGDVEVAGIARVLMESSKVYVWWDENQITAIRGFK